MKILDFEDNRVILYVEEPAFIALRRRDTSIRKLEYYKWMFYTYTVSDYNAHPARQGMNELETHEYALEAAGLDPGYIPDKYVQNAVHAYFKLRDTAAIRYIRVLQQAMGNSIVIVEQLNSINKELISLIEGLENNPDTIATKVAHITTVTNNQKILFSMSTDAQEQLNKLKKLNDIIKVEKEVAEKGLGGHEITSSMEPE